MLYSEIIAVCSQIHTKHINALCGQNAELLNFKLVVHMVTTGLWRANSTQLSQRNNWTDHYNMVQNIYIITSTSCRVEFQCSRYTCLLFPVPHLDGHFQELCPQWFHLLLDWRSCVKCSYYCTHVLSLTNGSQACHSSTNDKNLCRRHLTSSSDLTCSNTIIIQGASLIISPSTAGLSHRKPVTTGISHDKCCAQEMITETLCTYISVHALLHIHCTTAFTNLSLTRVLYSSKQKISRKTACLFYISHLPNSKLEKEMIKKKHVCSASVLHLTAYELRILESSGIRRHGISKVHTAFTFRARQSKYTACSCRWRHCAPVTHCRTLNEQQSVMYKAQ